jgi:hypothetical protein
MWIQGRDLSKRYRELSENELFEWCKAGRLQPFRKAGLEQLGGWDHKSPRGWRRVFPPGEANQKYSQLCGAYYVLLGWIKSARRSENEHIQAYQDSFARSLKESGRVIELPGIEQLKYVHFRFRQDGAAKIFRLFSEIEEITRDLDPGKVWGNPRLVFSDVLNLLMDSFFRSEDIDRLLSSSMPEHTMPERERIGFKSGLSTDKKKRQDQRDREAVEAWAREYFQPFQQTPDAAPKLIDVVRIAQAQLEAAKGWDERTLLDWIRTFHPRYTARKPGRKKGSKKAKQ